MGIAAGKRKKITENQLPVAMEVYNDMNGPITTKKDVNIIMHSHRTILDERLISPGSLSGSESDDVRSFSKICRITLENAERKGHPEINAPPKEVKPRNMTPTLRTAAMVKPIEF